MYLFYLADKQLPVAPAKFEIKVKNQNKTVNLINEGEINLLKLPGLSEFSFEVLLPNQIYPFASYPDGFHDGKYYLDWLELLKVRAQPFDLRIVRYIQSKQVCEDTLRKVSLEEYTVKEDVKEGTDFIVDIKLKEYLPFATGQFLKETTPASDGNPAEVAIEAERPAKEPEKSYTVQSGDKLWTIAQKQLGSGARWGEIYGLNSQVIEAAAKQHGRQSSSNGHWIYTGTMLKLPS